MMIRIPDAAAAGPRVQRQQRPLHAGEQRRRLQFGTPYPHRGPAPACQQRQRTYQPPRPGDPAGWIGDARKAGRLRVLNIPAEKSGDPVAG